VIDTVRRSPSFQNSAPPTMTSKRLMVHVGRAYT
jgi:hypothetical protein